MRAPQAADTLSPLARHYFAALPWAGAPATDSAGNAPGWLMGGAGSPAEDAQVIFHIRLSADAQCVTEARFQAYGCPHTLATAAWLAEQLPGRTRENLLPSPPADWISTLDVPVTKLGRLLIIVDALRAVRSRWPEPAIARTI